MVIETGPRNGRVGPDLYPPKATESREKAETIATIATAEIETIRDTNGIGIEFENGVPTTMISETWTDTPGTIVTTTTTIGVQAWEAEDLRPRSSAEMAVATSGAIPTTQILVDRSTAPTILSEAVILVPTVR